MTHLPPGYPQSINTNVDAAGNVAAEMPCRKCGYNLRGLPAAGLCPECGAAVALSIHGDLLRFSDPAWLRRLQGGVRLILASVAVTLFAVVLGFLAVTVLRSTIIDLRFANSLIAIAGALLGFWGGWQLTEPDPSGLGEDRYGTSRKIIRVSLAIGIANTALQFIEKLSTVRPEIAMTLSLIGAGSGLIGIVGEFAQLNYLAKLAMRIPDVALAARAGFLKWAFCLSWGFILLVGVVMRVARTMSGIAGPSAVLQALACPMGIAFVLGVIFGIMDLLMLWRFAKRFGESAAAAELTWAAVAASSSVAAVG
jgi:hypothetical protein